MRKNRAIDRDRMFFSPPTLKREFKWQDLRARPALCWRIKVNEITDHKQTQNISVSLNSIDRSIGRSVGSSIVNVIRTVKKSYFTFNSLVVQFAISSNFISFVLSLLSIFVSIFSKVCNLSNFFSSLPARHDATATACRINLYVSSNVVSTMTFAIGQTQHESFFLLQTNLFTILFPFSYFFTKMAGTVIWLLNIQNFYSEKHCFHTHWREGSCLRSSFLVHQFGIHRFCLFRA